MKLEYMKIDNFRGIPNVKMPLSNFVCIIGENNSGKSSTLLALNIFYDGPKLNDSDYFDKSQKIKIGIKFSGICDDDLNRLSIGHRERIKEIIIDRQLYLTRIYDNEGNSRFYYKRLLPKDSRYSDERITSLLKGKRGKEIEDIMKTEFSEHISKFDGVITQKKAREVLIEIINDISNEEKHYVDSEIPTGMDSSVKDLLPVPIYIAAVKDLADEVKTKQTATFGKLLNFVMSLIMETERFQDITQSFDELNRLLNRNVDEGETKEDNRLPEIIDIEKRIEKNLQESFPNVKLDINISPPKLNQIFSNAQILLDDGVRDLIETKGDGIKRSMVFSLLRTYVDLQREKEKKLEDNESENNQVSFRPYLILFEEPELYLHPNTQKILFSALEGLSENNYVVMTTHAPNFYSPDQIATFVHLRKIYPSEGVPYGVAKSIDLLSEFSLRNALRLICYENNSAAFFSKKVLLVEGESDLFFIRHISNLLNPNWDFCQENIPIIQIHGKGNIKLYKEFFEYFDIEVHLLLDLDVLVKEFGKLNLEAYYNEEHNKIIQKLDVLIKQKNIDTSLNRSRIRDIITKMSFRKQYDRLKELVNKIKKNESLNEDEIIEIELLFSEEIDYRRIEAIKQGLCKDEITKFLFNLYKEKVYLLSKGTIEDYYPSEASGREKTEKSLSACDLIRSKEDCEQLLPKLELEGKTVNEFKLIFRNIFGQ